MRRLFHTNDNRYVQLLKDAILVACVTTATVIPSLGEGCGFGFHPSPEGRGMDRGRDGMRTGTLAEPWKSNTGT